MTWKNCRPYFMTWKNAHSMSREEGLVTGTIEMLDKWPMSHKDDPCDQVR